MLIVQQQQIAEKIDMEDDKVDIFKLAKRVEELEAWKRERQGAEDPNQLVLNVGGKLFPSSRDDIARTNADSLLYTTFCGREETKGGSHLLH